MKIIITDEMREQANFVYAQRHARINAINAIEMEVFKQKNGRYPEIIEIWDFDQDIKENAKDIEKQLFEEYLTKCERIKL